MMSLTPAWTKPVVLKSLTLPPCNQGNQVGSKAWLQSQDLHPHCAHLQHDASLSLKPVLPRSIARLHSLSQSTQLTTALIIRSSSLVRFRSMIPGVSKRIIWYPCTGIISMEPCLVHASCFGVRQHGLVRSTNPRRLVPDQAATFKGIVGMESHSVVLSPCIRLCTNEQGPCTAPVAQQLGSMVCAGLKQVQQACLHGCAPC